MKTQSLHLGLVALIVLAPLTSEAQQVPAENVDRLISDSGLTWPLVEPHLAVNPTNSDHLVATAIAVRSLNWNVEFSSTCMVFTTFDGGVSWSQIDFNLTECGDPWVAVTPEGVVLFTALGRPEGEDDGLWVWRSTDGGRSWPEAPVSLGGGFDHQTMTIDLTGGEYSGSVYLVAAEYRRRAGQGFDSGIHIGRSDNAGSDFSVHEHVIPSNLALEAQTPVILSDGSLVVPFSDHQTRWRRRLERRRSWVVVSEDGGLTYSAPRFVTESCARTRPVAWPSMAVDNSGGPFSDRMYWLCEDQDFRGVLIHHSDDKGETWSEPLRIGHEGQRNPYTKTPTMAVNGNGALGLVWYDGRAHSWHACHQIFFTHSSDGGVTFSEPAAVTTEQSCPFTPQNGDAAWRWPGGGDYIGMVALSDGRFVTVWSDSRDGTYRLRMATISLNPSSG